MDIYDTDLTLVCFGFETNFEVILWVSEYVYVGPMLA